MIVIAVAGTVNAATEAEKRTAIDAGLAYLATQQLASGAIGTSLQGVDYLQAQTGSAMLAFLEEKPNWGANAAAYQAVVDKGINYILGNASVVPISPYGANDPDGDGNGIGVKLYPGGPNGRDTYVTGISLPAIAASGTPNKLVTTGVLASRTDGSGAGGAWTYRDVVQNVIDYDAFGQTEASTTMRGGWRYQANSGTSDQSTTQWPVIAGAYASLMGVSYPAYVKTELALWTNNIQYPDGGGGYYPVNYNVRYGEMNETGALLLEQDFLNWNLSDPKVQAALNYINQGWKWGLGSGGAYDGNIGHPYAMWAIYKGLQLTIGLDDMTTILNLNPDPGDVDNPNHGYNWWEDYCEWLVNNQGVGAPAGAWAGYSSWGSYLATPWYINILAATEIPDVNVPVPGAFLLGSIGLAFASRKLQRRKEL
jgi:hypothetical protein